MTGKRRGPRPLKGFRYDSRSGRLVLTVYVPGTAGKVKRQRSLTVANRDEAMTAWKTFRDELVARGGRATVWTIRTYVERFRPVLTARLRPQSVAVFDLDVRRLRALLGEMPLGRINAAAVRDMVAVQSRTLAPATVNRTLATLRKILRDAVDREELAVFPVRGKLPVMKEPPLRLELSDEERARFLAAFDDFAGFRRHLEERRVVSIAAHQPTGLPGRDTAGEHVLFSWFRESRPLFVVALETGLSRSDLLALRWKDVQGRVIRVPRRKTGVESVIPISPACRAALDEIPRAGLLVFHGTSMTSVRRYFTVAKRIAGIDRRLRFHDLRHSFASRLASQGVSLQVIARRSATRPPT